VSWLVKHGHSLSRTTATRLMDDLFTVGALTHVTRAHTFKDDSYFYRWASLEFLEHLLSTTSECTSSENQNLQLSATSLFECRAELIDLHGKISRRAKTRHAAWLKNVQPRLSDEISTLTTQLEEIDKMIRAKETSSSSKVLDDALQLEQLEKMCVQKKNVAKRIDELQVECLFPGDADEYDVRGGSDGVYVGARRMAIEKFETKWKVELGAPEEQTTSSATTTTTALTLTANPINLSLSFEDFSIQSLDKKSGVPTLSRDRLSLSTKITLIAVVEFNTKTSTWHATSFTFEVAEISRLEGGAKLLPTSLLQWLINSFVPSRVKTSITETLPPELYYFLCTGNHLRLGGSLSMYGIPLDVLGCELKMSKTLSSVDISNVFRDGKTMMFCCDWLLFFFPFFSDSSHPLPPPPFLLLLFSSRRRTSLRSPSSPLLRQGGNI